MVKEVQQLDPKVLKLRGELEAFGVLRAPSEAEQPILSASVRQAMHQWVVEQGAAAELKAIGLKPRSRALMEGPPGCGKTTLAHHLAARLGLPMLIVDCTQLVSRYVNQSTEQVGQLFRAVQRHGREIVIFLDEIDSIARKRGAEKNGASQEETKMVIGLMQQLDLRADCYVFAATNRIDTIDPAVHRRFDIRMEIALPDADARYAILKRYLSPFAWDDGVEALVPVTDGATPALLKDLAEGLKREVLLGPRLKLDPSIGAVFGRVLVTVQPPPELVEGNKQRPPLWNASGAEIGGMLQGNAWPPVQGTSS